MGNNAVEKRFKKSEQEYREFKRKNKRLPTTEEWNKIALEKNLLSNVSMRYIGNIKFKRKNS